MAKEKTRDLHIRLTESEYEEIKSKAEIVGSTTKLVVKAVQEYNQVDGRSSIEILNEWAAYYRECKVSIDRVGNNLNQIAYVINLMKLNGSLNLSDNMLSEIQTFNAMLRDLSRIQEKLIKKIVK